MWLFCVLLVFQTTVATSNHFLFGNKNTGSERKTCIMNLIHISQTIDLCYICKEDAWYRSKFLGSIASDLGLLDSCWKPYLCRSLALGCLRVSQCDPVAGNIHKVYWILWEGVLTTKMTWQKFSMPIFLCEHIPGRCKPFFHPILIDFVSTVSLFLSVERFPGMEIFVGWLVWLCLKEVVWSCLLFNESQQLVEGLFNMFPYIFTANHQVFRRPLCEKWTGRRGTCIE